LAVSTKALTALVSGVIVAALLPSTARAAPPVLLSVGQIQGHPQATWSLPPGVTAQVLEIATSPLTGSDGAFFFENVEIFDLLEDTQTSYTSSRRLPPGAYYVHLSGLDEPCFYSGACPVREYSSILPLTIPNTPPTLRIKRVRGNTLTGGVATLQICDQEGGDATVFITQRRLRRSRVVASATSTDDAFLLGPCDEELVFWKIPRKLYRRGDVYRVSFQVRDQHGARSQPAVWGTRWR
jgi:hypothetical protein